MLEFYEPCAAIIEDSAAHAVARATKANRNALDFTFRAQKAMLEEMIFASNEIFDRIRTETHLFSEFASKMAGSHSVRELKTMCEECSQHQIDFVRRDKRAVFQAWRTDDRKYVEPVQQLATELIGISYPGFEGRS